MAVAYSIEPSKNSSAITLNEFREITQRLSFEHPERLCEIADVFAQLNANKRLLIDFINDNLVNWVQSNLRNAYTGQTFLLADYGNYYIRANVWLPRNYAGLPSAASSDQFFYELPHDHNFSFLTAGHIGSGYRTKIYEHDGEPPGVGEAIDANFLEETQLHEGKLMVYRASRDIHVQYPPDEFSISLNVMTRNRHEFAKPQCILDSDCRTVVRHSTGVDPAKSYFFRTAAFLGDQETLDLLESFVQAGGDTPLTRVARESLELRRSIDADA